MNSNQHAAGSGIEEVPAEIQGAPDISVPLVGVGSVRNAATGELSDHHASFAESHNSYVREMIVLADTKGAWAFALTSGVLAYVLGDDVVRSVLAAPTWSTNFAMIAACVLFLTLSAGSAFLTIAPRLSSSTAEGLVFFGAVASRTTGNEYVGDVARATASDLVEAKLKHSYDISRICTRKYDFLRRAIWLGMVGLVDALFVMVWIAR